MNETVLDEVVKRCNEGNMSQEDLVMSVGAIANYLREGSTVGQFNKNADSNAQNVQGKEYIKDEIKRVEDFITKELVTIEKRLIKVEEMIKINDKQSEDVNMEKDSKLPIEFEERMIKIEDSFKEQIERLNFDVRKLNEVLIENIKQVKPFKKQGLNSTQKLQKVQHKNRTLSQNTNQKQKLKQTQMSMQTKQSMKLEFYKQQKWANLFEFDGKTLTKVQENGKLYQYVFFEFVPFNKLFTFKVKIVQSKNRYIFIGVVDYDKQKEDRISFNSNNATCYYARDGSKYPGYKKEGNGVKQGETVEVRVDRKSKTIKRMVNNQQRASFILNMLGEQDRKLMPFVEMEDVGDIIEYSF